MSGTEGAESALKDDGTRISQSVESQVDEQGQPAVPGVETSSVAAAAQGSTAEESSVDPDVADAHVVEVDETYVIESLKGTRVLPEVHGRGPRKRGTPASKPGISREQICIVAGVNRQGKTLATTVNRASPTVDDLTQALDHRVPAGSLVLCDGQSSYPGACAALGCSMRNVNKVADEERSLINLNHVNNFHSLIKERLRKYRGVATCYMNRYNALWNAAYVLSLEGIDSIARRFLTASDEDFVSTYADVKGSHLTAV